MKDEEEDLNNSEIPIDKDDNVVEDEQSQPPEDS